MPCDAVVNEDIPITIRLMFPEEGAALARCLYRVYEYSYFEYAYFPEKIRDLIESGLQVSVVALNQDNEIIAYQSYVKRHPGAFVAELEAGIVDPRYRGRGIFERSAKIITDYAREQGLYGLFIEAVAVHPYSQKTSLAAGAIETGILPGLIPARFNFKKIAKVIKQRHTAVLMYNRLNPEPDRTVYPPCRHRAIIEKIYDYGVLNRTFGDDTEWPEGMDKLSHLEINVNRDMGVACFSLIRYGKDFQDCIRYHLRDMCLQKIDCIFLDLPLSNPATVRGCAMAEMLGFFFAGLVPELDNGDVLRLEYLNNVKINPSEAVVASDFGKYLLDYVRKEYEKAFPD